MRPITRRVFRFALLLAAMAAALILSGCNSGSGQQNNYFYLSLPLP